MAIERGGVVAKLCLRALCRLSVVSKKPTAREVYSILWTVHLSLSLLEYHTILARIQLNSALSG